MSRMNKSALRQLMAWAAFRSTLLRHREARSRKTLVAFRRLPPPGVTFPRRKGWPERLAARRRESKGTPP